MFSISHINEAHAKAKTGADFPRYIADISFSSKMGTANILEKMAFRFPLRTPIQPVAAKLEAELFYQWLRVHQKGETTYAIFCGDCAELGGYDLHLL